MWRYAPALPVQKPNSIISLGEGMTPLLPAAPHGRAHRRERPADQGRRPESDRLVQSPRALLRGLDVRGTRRQEVLAIPSAGNAASALAAYAAAAGIEAHIFMPARRAAGQFHRMQGVRRARDAGRWPDQRLRHASWRNAASRRRRLVRYHARSKSPIASKARRRWATRSPSNSAGTLPDAIFYPTGGGVGMIGMWKAFDEMEALGWIGSEAAENDRGAGGRLPAHRARVPGGREAQPVSGKAPRRSPAGCACRSRWAIFWCCRPCAKAAARRSRCRIAN